MKPWEETWAYDGKYRIDTTGAYPDGDPRVVERLEVFGGPFNAEVIDFPVWTGTWTDVYSELEIAGAEHARAQQGPYQLDSGSFVRFPRGEIVADVLEP